MCTLCHVLALALSPEPWVWLEVNNFLTWASVFPSVIWDSIGSGRFSKCLWGMRSGGDK